VTWLNDAYNKYKNTLDGVVPRSLEISGIQPGVRVPPWAREISKYIILSSTLNNH
jgi:hypothetical protein